MTPLQRALQQSVTNGNFPGQPAVNPFANGNPSPPVPLSTFQTNQLPGNIVSPVPQSQVAPFFAGDIRNVIDKYNPPTQVASPSLAQQALDMFFGGKKTAAAAGISQPSPTATPQPVSQAVKQMPSSTPTPTQAPDNSNAFADFQTAKVPKELSSLISSSAKNANVDPNVFASLLFSEHGFQTTPGINRNADGSYDRGIAQINTKAHPEVTDEQALDPNFAIPYAAKLLGSHIKNLGYQKGIAAYNVGEGGATINGDSGDLGPKGQAYVDKIANGLSPKLRKQLGIKTSN